MLKVFPGVLTYETLAEGRIFALEVPALTIKSGSVFVLRGANGCGKSSLLSVIAGQIKPNLVTNIRATWEREGKTQPAHAVASYCAASPALLPARSVKDYIRFAGYCRSVRSPLSKLEASSMLCNFGINHEVHCATPEMLSTGQIKRVVMARIVVQGLPLLLLDEPTANLDDEAEKLFQTVVEKQLSLGGVVIIASHDHDFALSGIRRAAIVRRAPREYFLAAE